MNNSTRLILFLALLTVAMALLIPSHPRSASERSQPGGAKSQRAGDLRATGAGKAHVFRRQHTESNSLIADATVPARPPTSSADARQPETELERREKAATASTLTASGGGASTGLNVTVLPKQNDALQTDTTTTADARALRLAGANAGVNAGTAPQPTAALLPDANLAPQPDSALVPDSQSFANGSAPLVPGESLVIGGWEMADDQRGYALVTPELVTEENGSNSVRLISRLIAIPSDALEALGLKDFTVEGGAAERYGVADPKLLRDLFARLATVDGVKLISTPSTTSVPGNESEMHLGTSLGHGIRIRFKPNFTADGAGFNLGFDFSQSMTGR